MGVAPKDATIPENCLCDLTLDKHIDFIANYETNKNTSYEYSMSESLRMSGIYWACTALDIMNASDRMEKNRVCLSKYVHIHYKKCFQIFYNFLYLMNEYYNNFR